MTYSRIQNLCKESELFFATVIKIICLNSFMLFILQLFQIEGVFPLTDCVIICRNTLLFLIVVLRNISFSP